MIETQQLVGRNRIGQTFAVRRNPPDYWTRGLVVRFRGRRCVVAAFGRELDKRCAYLATLRPVA